MSTSHPQVNQTFSGDIYAEKVGVIHENAKSGLDILKPYVNHTAAYNSAEREREEATICQPGTRTRVLGQIQGWVRGDGPSTMWLYGPAGAGKSTIAYTIAEQCDKQSPRNLTFSYFFSRRNTNRNDMTKFIPTFAYQLLSRMPSLDQSIKQAVEFNPSIFSCRLRDQVQTLIAGPLRKMSNQIHPMSVVIDGLDEYSEESGKIPLRQLIEVIFNSLKDLPFRFFFASRPEPYIRAIFDGPSISSRLLMIPIFDWETKEDIYKYFSSALLEVQRKKGLPSSWPSQSNLRTLVDKSEGIFIYASTLVKFVGAKNCNAKTRLQKAIESHNGLDSLFVQVLDDAKEHDDFQYTLGVIMFLQKRLSIGELTRFLQRDTYDVRSSFEGSLSILFVPDNDGDYIRPYHASLQDFLTDPHRSRNHSLDPVKNHVAIIEASARLIETDSNYATPTREHLSYAYQNWCYHLLSALSDSNFLVIYRSLVHGVCSKLAERLLSQRWTWLHRMQSYKRVEEWLANLREAIPYIEREASQFEGFIRAVVQLQNSIGKFMEIYHRVTTQCQY